VKSGAPKVFNCPVDRPIQGQAAARFFYTQPPPAAQNNGNPCNNARRRSATVRTFWG